jgi:hypothetical protein
LAGGEIELEGSRAVFRLTAAATGAELVHPLLAAAAAGRMRLLGHDVLHAGAVLVDGQAWAIAGDRESGKSTLLATLATTGALVLSDDLLVIADGLACAGPRCLDLRDDTIIDGVPRGTLVRAATRRRVGLAPSPSAAPFAGIVYLAWAGREQIVRVAPGEQLLRIARLRRWPFVAADPHAVLDLATLPAIELQRPRDRARLTHTATKLLQRMRT